MEKKIKLINKVKRLLKRLGCPRWLHHFGPKKYEFWQHIVALFVKQECKLGYRRVSRLLDYLGFDVPTYSALAKMVKRIPLTLWQNILKLTASFKTYIVSIDGTGMSRPLPSPYYYKRIDKPYPVEIPLKLSMAIDTRTKKILALRIRAKPRHDIKDAKYLIKRLTSKPNKLVADKGYDADWLRKLCNKQRIISNIPKRSFSKDTHYRKTATKRAIKLFNKKTYGRREMSESVFSSFKRRFGPSLSSVKISAQRAEAYCRAIAYNIIYCFSGLFQRNPN
jgi:transposase